MNALPPKPLLSRYQPISLVRALQDFLFDDDANSSLMRGGDPADENHNLVQAGVISIAGSTSSAFDIFYSVWLIEGTPSGTNELVFKFEGASDADVAHLKALAVKAGPLAFENPIEWLSPHQIRSVIHVPASAVVNGAKRLVNTPFELNVVS